MKLFILLGLLVLVVGCTADVDDVPTEIPAPPEMPAPDDQIPGAPVEYEYSEGVLSYSIDVIKPNPCYTLDVQELSMESFPVQIRVDITLIPPSEDVICIQVIDVETVSGQIEIDHEPTFSVYVGEDRIY